MSGAVDDERLLAAVQYLAPDQLCSMRRALIVDTLPRLFGLDTAPVDRRLAEPHPDALIGRARQVHFANYREEGLVADALERRIVSQGIAPHLRQLGVRHILAIEVSVENVLVLGRAELHDDIAHLRGKAWIPYHEGVEVQFVREHVELAEPHQRMRFEGLEDAINRWPNDRLAG